MSSAATESRMYYGWYVLAAAALMEMIGTGAASYGAGLFMPRRFLAGPWTASRSDGSFLREFDDYGQTVPAAISHGKAKRDHGPTKIQ